MCDAVYLNLFDNFNKWYTPYEKKRRKTIVRLNTVILDKVKVQSIMMLLLLLDNQIR